MTDTTGRALLAAADRRTLRGATVFSIGAHFFFFLLAGVAIRSDVDALQIPPGYVVELVDVPEAVKEVVAPVEGVADSRGEIPLPRDRRMPKTKPKARPTPKAPQRPVKTDEAPEKTPPPVTASETEGAGGRMETEVPFPFHYYTETITRLILSNWAPTTAAKDSTRAVVGFVITRAGTTEDIVTLVSSGSPGFDRDALAAVRSVGRFPPLPGGFRHDRLKIRFHFQFQRGF